jgi:hypothetical protein
MWFAALSDFNSNPWLLKLVYNLLQPINKINSKKKFKKSNNKFLFSFDMFELIDFENYPFNLTDPPVVIRGKLYEYDFTRLNTTWANSMNEITIVKINHKYLLLLLFIKIYY